MLSDTLVAGMQYPGGYGTSTVEKRKPPEDNGGVAKFPKRSISNKAFAALFFWPTIVFMIFMSILSFDMRHTGRDLAYLIVGIFCLLCFFGIWRQLYWWCVGRLNYTKWHFIFSFMTVLSIGFGISFGNSLYYNYSYRWYTWQELASYIEIDPANARGQSYMDSGEVYFKSGTRVASEDATAFRAGEMYCVAPIIGKPLQKEGGGVDGGYETPPSGTIDFWAVGKDCCLATGKEYTCGDVRNNKARAALRLVYSKDREMYKLAVKQWTAEYGLPAKHPLFFEWVADPVYHSAGVQSELWYQWGLWIFIWQLIATFVVFQYYYWVPEATKDWNRIYNKQQEPINP